MHALNMWLLLPMFRPFSLPTPASIHALADKNHDCYAVVVVAPHRIVRYLRYSFDSRNLYLSRLEFPMEDSTDHVALFVTKAGATRRDLEPN